MFTKIGLLNLLLTIATVCNFQERDSRASDELLDNRPIFYYLPFDSTASDSNELRTNVAQNGKQWKAVATRGVEFIETNDDIHSKSARFDGMNLVELEGSS